jgi:DNA-binding beta-propeller fold protein YncE
MNGTWRERNRVRRVTAVVLALGLVSAGAARAVGPPGPAAVNALLPGGVRMPNGWALNPAGTQVVTDRAPTGVTVAPDGHAAYAVTSGIFTEAVEAVDAKSLVAVPTTVGSAYQGVAADGTGNVWASGGPDNVVHQYTAVGPALVDIRQAGPVPGSPSLGIPVTGYPGTMLLAGHLLFVAGNLSVPAAVAKTASHGAVGCANSDICSVINVVDVSSPLATSPVVNAIPVGRDAFGLAYRPASRTLYVANWADQTNPARAGGAGTVSVVSVSPAGSGREVQVIPVGKGPTGVALSPDGHTLAVADSDSDQISLLSIGSDGMVTGTRVVAVGVRPGAPLGSAPVAVSFSPDGSLLYAALSGLNALEVLTGDGQPIPESVTVPYQGRKVSVRVPATYVPTGWYPDAMAIAPGQSGSGTRLYVANLRGEGAGPGLFYGQLEPVVGSGTEGSLSVIDVPAAASARAQAFASWTSQVVANDQLAPVWDAQLADPAADSCLPAPLPGGGQAVSSLLCDAQQGRLDPRPLHVVQIMAENKTFDSYFGDTKAQFPGANANPLYTLYGQPITPNQHQLAKQFNVADDFWNEGAESSVLGHSWLTGGYTTVANELGWGQSYDQKIRGNRPGGQYSGTVVGGKSDPAVAAQEGTMLDPRARLVDLIANPAIDHFGLTQRIYGTDVSSGSAANADLAPQGLWGEGPTSPVDTDLAFPDVDRANMFLHGQTVSHAWDVLQGGAPPKTFGQTLAFSPADKAKYTLDSWTAAYQRCRQGGGSDATCQTAMPNYLYLQLPENHTFVVSNVFNPVDPTPQSMVADNDYAIGLIAQALSKSPFWQNTLFLVTEDDNQFTGDHVDLHRTFLLSAGGLARRLGPAGQVAKQTGSFPSVLKTVEVLFGLPPLTLFDWRATPLQDVLVPSLAARTPSTYQAVTPAVPFLLTGK